MALNSESSHLSLLIPGIAAWTTASKKYTGFCCFLVVETEPGIDVCLNEASENLFALFFMSEYTEGSSYMEWALPRH